MCPILSIPSPPSPPFAAPCTHLSSRQSSFPALHLPAPAPPTPCRYPGKSSAGWFWLCFKLPLVIMALDYGPRGSWRGTADPSRSRASECAWTKGETHSYSMSGHDGDTCQRARKRATHAHVAHLLTHTHTHAQGKTGC